MMANKTAKASDVEKISWRRCGDFAPTDWANKIPAPIEIIEKNKKTVLLICPAMEIAAATESLYADNIQTTRLETTMTNVTSKIRGSDNFKNPVD